MTDFVMGCFFGHFDLPPWSSSHNLRRRSLASFRTLTIWLDNSACRFDLLSFYYSCMNGYDCSVYVARKYLEWHVSTEHNIFRPWQFTLPPSSWESTILLPCIAFVSSVAWVRSISTIPRICPTLLIYVLLLLPFVSPSAWICTMNNAPKIVPWTSCAGSFPVPCSCKWAPQSVQGKTVNELMLGTLPTAITRSMLSLQHCLQNQGITQWYCWQAQSMLYARGLEQNDKVD